MKQLWLINPLPTNESTLTLELDSHACEELVTLMATAIASVHLQQTSLTQQDKETSNERIATSQD
jgi:hypothetical protein